MKKGTMWRFGANTHSQTPMLGLTLFAFCSHGLEQLSLAWSRVLFDWGTKRKSKDGCRAHPWNLPPHLSFFGCKARLNDLMTFDCEQWCRSRFNWNDYDGRTEFQGGLHQVHLTHEIWTDLSSRRHWTAKKNLPTHRFWPPMSREPIQI